MSTPTPGAESRPGASTAAVAAAERPLLLQTFGELPAPQEYDTLLFLLFPSQISSDAVLKMLARVGCAVGSKGSSSKGMQGGGAMAVADARGSSSCVLLRTNEAPVSQGLLQQMAVTAEWSKTQIREFSAKGEKKTLLPLYSALVQHLLRVR